MSLSGKPPYEIKMFRIRNKTVEKIIAPGKTLGLYFGVPGQPCIMAIHAISDRRDTLKQDHSMEDPGYRLKRVREHLNLTLRDVENDSQIIVDRRQSTGISS